MSKYAGILGMFLAGCAAAPATLPKVIDVDPVAVPVIEPAPEPTAAAPVTQPEVVKAEPTPDVQVLGSGLGIVELKEGTGAEIKPGDIAVVHYVGHLADGTEIDSSRARGTPFEFEIDAGMVIKGWDEGVAGMRVGGLRRLIIPPHLAYGSTARASIPANSILEFEIELLEIK